MSILEFAKMKIKNLCKKKRFYGKAYENFIKITENLVNTSFWLIEKRDFKTEFKQTQKWVLLIDLFILLEVKNNKINIFLKEKILFMLTKFINFSDGDDKMEIEATDLMRLFNDFIKIEPVKKNGQIVKLGWIFFMLFGPQAEGNDQSNSEGDGAGPSKGKMHNKFFRKLNDEYGAGNNTLKKYKDKCELEQWSSGLSAVLPDFVVIVTRNITNYKER